MKKLLLLFLICFEASIYAQSFTMSFDSYIKRDTLNSEIVFDGHIKNVSSQNISVYFVRKLNDLPANWTSSFCFDNCFPPTLDSIATTADFLSSPLTPNETREFSIHVSPAVVMGEPNFGAAKGAYSWFIIFRGNQSGEQHLRQYLSRMPEGAGPLRLAGQYPRTAQCRRMPRPGHRPRRTGGGRGRAAVADRNRGQLRTPADRRRIHPSAGQRRAHQRGAESCAHDAARQAEEIRLDLKR